MTFSPKPLNSFAFLIVLFLAVSGCSKEQKQIQTSAPLSNATMEQPAANENVVNAKDEKIEQPDNANQPNENSADSQNIKQESEHPDTANTVAQKQENADKADAEPQENEYDDILSDSFTHEDKCNFDKEFEKYINYYKNKKFTASESDLPIPLVKVSANEDVVTKLEKTLNLRCQLHEEKSINAYSARLLFCDSKDDVNVRSNGINYSDNDIQYGLNQSTNLYLSVFCPKDKTHRIYKIEEDLDVTSGEYVDNYYNTTIQIEGMDEIDILDTHALYIRLLYEHSGGYEHPEVSAGQSETRFTSYLFAGDKLRLFDSWVDTVESSSYQTDCDIDGENCETDENKSVDCAKFEDGMWK